MSARKSLTDSCECGLVNNREVWRLREADFIICPLCNTIPADPNPNYSIYSLDLAQPPMSYQGLSEIKDQRLRQMRSYSTY